MNHVIIVAGGKGLRMGADTPKQFLPIGGLPVLMRTINSFKAYKTELNIVLVLPESQREYWQELCGKYSFDVPHTIAAGGATRFHSVANGLAMIADDDDGLVAVHDGVRPFASAEVIGECFRQAALSGAAIPVTPVVETLRRTDGTTVQRADYRLVQTPQTFSTALLKEAYSQPYRDTFTDDASVVEALGHRVDTVEGTRENIKLTTPFDIIVAEAIIAAKATRCHKAT